MFHVEFMNKNGNNFEKIFQKLVSKSFKDKTYNLLQGLPNLGHEKFLL